MKTKFTLLSKFNLQTVFTFIVLAATCTFVIGQIVKKVPRIISNANTVNVDRIAGPSCEGLWTITNVRSYDPVSNTTTYTFSITRTGAQNALSHWGFPITLCPGQSGTVEQILNGYTAETSLDQTTWTPANTSYGEDPSTNPECTNGPVFKFEEDMGSETTRYFRLTLMGSWSLIPETAYVKYGNNCCNITLNTPGCLEEDCIPPPCTISGNNNICPSSTNTYSGSAGNDTYNWAITSGGATIIGSSTSPTVQVQAGAACGFFTLRLTTTKGQCQSVCSETYTIADAAPPTFSGSYADVNLGCNPANPSGSLGTATASDACGAVTITSSDAAVVSDGCSRSQTRTFTARDACNNTTSVSRTVRWASDNTNTPPTFTGSYADVNLGCNPTSPSGSLGTATASDACGAVTITSSDGTVVSDGCSRSQTRTFTARDACNNTASVSRTVRWTADNTAPTFTGSYTEVNLGCNPADPAGSLGTATASDACGAVTITSSDGAVVSDGCSRSQTRTFTARDACNNTASVSRTVRWAADNTNTPPSFTGSYTDVNLGCNPANPAGSLGTATASDACGAVTITSTDGTVVSDGCSRSQIRTFTARDACNNTATVSRTVRWTADNTAPTFTGSYTDVNLGCNPANPAGSLGTATASDACGAVTITSSDGAVVSDGCSRSQTRTFTARDACNNTTSVSRTVRWAADNTNTPPIFTGSYTEVNLGCNPGDPSGSLGTATANDACGAVTITSQDGAVVSDGCSRSQTRTFTARDACNNTASVSRTVRWTADNTAPSFTGSYTDVNLGCNPANPAGSLGTATANDACGAVTITSTDGAVVSDGCSRSQTRTFAARDACNNTASVSRTVRWTADNTAPSFTGSYADVILACVADAPGSLGTATATDACGAVTITSSDGSIVSNGCNRSIARTFTARDACGNTATISRTVRWISILSGPILFVGGQSITGTTTFDLGCNPLDATVNATLGEATATNECGSVSVSAFDGPVTSDGCNRARVRTFSATDGCGNIATAARIVRWIVSNIGGPQINPSSAPTVLGCNPSENDINAALGTVTATDACASITITSSDGQTQSDGCSRSRTRTFTATNGCGNTATASRTITWTADNTAPTFTGSYTDVNLGCNPANPAGSLGSATASDACGAVTITSQDGAVVSDGCNRSQIRTFTARDACNNTVTVSRVVRWTADNTAPTFTGSYTDVNLGCNPANPAGSLGTATANDACGAVTITSTDGAVVSDGCSRSQTRTFTARDACNNTASVSRTVRWTADNTAPSFTGSYTDVILGCNPANPSGSLGTATATDACGAVTITSSDGAVVSEGCNRSQTRTFTVRDACGNTATVSRTVRWTADNIPPVITTGGTTTILGCNPSANDINGALGTATASDVCGTTTETGGGPLPGSCVRDYKGNNGGGNCPDLAGLPPTGKVTLFFTSAVTIAPSILSVTDNDPVSDLSNVRFGPGDLSNDGLSAEYCYYDGPNNNNNLWGGGIILTFNLQFATGQGCTEQAPGNPGNPGGSGTVVIPTSNDGPVVSNGCIRSQTRTWTAIDACGNTATASRTVTWTADNTAPTFTGSYTDVNLGCNPANPAGSLGTATANDACGAVTITSQDGAVVSDGCSRSQTRTFTARDACNNTASVSRTVRWTADNTAPTFTGSYVDVNLGCNPANPAGSLGTATASDACGAVTITSSDGAVVSDGCSRSQTRTFTARDACNNTTSVSRTVRWTADNTAPTFTGSYTDVNLGCNPANPAGSLGTATASDACGAVTITSQDGAVVSDGCSRSQTRTFTARDACNNTATVSRVVRWTADNTAPTFTGSYAEVNLGCNPANPAGSLGTATASDACGAVTITSTDGAVVSDGCSRSQTRTFTARDACNNTASVSRTVRWTADNTAPTFTGSYTDVNLGCNPANPAGSLGTATANDACGAVTITSQDGAVVSDGCNRSQTRTFTARDACNNTTSVSRTVRWTADNTAPTFTGSYTDVNLGCNPANPAGSLGTATASDACGAVTITSQDGVVVSDGCNRSQTRTFTARDACNNTASVSRTVRWTADNTAPTFTGSYTDVNLGCNPANPAGSLGTATATDACGAVTITSSDGAVVSDGCNRSQTRTFTARDACGNTATVSRTVRWTADNIPPVITTGGTTTTLGCNPSANDIGAALGTATATDACGTLTATGQGSLPGSCVREYKGNNGGGNCPDLAGLPPTGKVTLFFTSAVTVAPSILSVTDNDPVSDLSNVRFGPGDLSNDGLSAEYCYYDGPNNNNNLWGGGIILTFNLQFATGQGCTEQAPGNPGGSGTVVIPTSNDGPVVSNGCIRSQTRTWTAIDACGNTATASRTITWTADNTAPTFTGSYTDVNLGCNPANPAGSLGTATANDACGAVTITSTDGAVVSDGCSRSQTRTFTARDACNNTTSVSRTVRWTADNTAPTFTGSYTDVNLGCNPANPAGSLGTATASDACGAVTITSQDGAVVSDGCNRSQTRTFTARDACNNTASVSRTVRWTADNTAPTFTGSYTDVNLGCNPANPAGSLGTATANDACGAVTITSSDGAVVSDGCNRSQTRTFTARDACNNTASVSRTVRWTADNTAPTFTGSYTEVNLGCNPGDPAGSLGTATANDACGAVTITSQDGAVVSDGCSRSQTRTFTARDACNNTASVSRTVRWTADNTAPTFTGSYTDVNLGCNPANPAGSLGTATASDACGAVTITSTDGAVVSDGCSRSQTRTFTARDACNNTASVSRTVRWTADNTAPTFTGSYTDVNLGCNPANPAGSLGTATANDACGAVTITSTDGAVVSDGCSRSQTRTFTARDACNNTASVSRTVRWTADNTAPTFTGSYTDVNLGCNPADPSGSLGTATANDACGAVTITSTDGAVVSDGCNRSQTRTFTARDACNNTASVSRTVRWTADNTAPTFTGSYTDVNLGCNPANPAGSLGTATANDACGAVTITSSDGAVVSDGCSRSQTRTFTARDACNNTASVSRTVRWTADNTAPTFTGSYTDVNLGCNPGDPAGSLGTATATDACGAVTITSSDGAIVSDGCSRSQTRTFTARDACNNTASVSRTVRWTADNTAPTFTGSYTDVNLGCNPANPAGSLGTATASDACGAVTITSSDGAVVSDGCNRSQIRTFTARDACNNTASVSRTVRWTADNTAPTFTGSYTDVNLGCNPANPAGSLGTATATDACGAVTITSSDGAVVSDGCNRSQTRTFTARDACNNTASVSRTVRWTADNTAPTFTGSYTDVNLGCNPANPAGSLGTATASDACGAVTITSSDGAVVSDGCSRSQTRTFTARDACNNTASVSRTVRWTADNTAPTFTGSYTDVNLGCNPANPAGSLGTATANDACGAVTITSQDGAVVSDGCSRSQTRTFTARDACNNTASVSRTVRWTADNTAPSFTGSYTDVNLGCNPANPAGSLGSATASDACGAVTITSQDGAVVSDGCSRSQTRTFTARDACNNTASVSRTVSWTADNTAPTFTGSYTEVNLGCNPGDPAGSLGTATASDACGAVTITSSDGAVASDGCNRSQIRTFTARDACNNTASVSRTVRWTADNTAPTFTGSYTDVNLGCNPADPAGSLGTATANDACGAVTITSTDGAVISDGCSRSQTRTFTARDACNNTASVSRTVRWTADNTAPTFTGSYTDVNLGCNPANPSGSLGTATANDACGAVTITSTDGAVVSDGCSRSQTRTFTARDACNNTATVSRTVRWTADNTAPSFTGSYTDVNLGCNPANPAGSLGTATASDACGAVTITSSDGAVASDGCNRSQIRTFTARDACNNTASVSRTVRWTADNTAPTFTGSYTDVNLGCNPGDPSGSLGTATATDACGAVTITSSDGAIVSDGCNRSQTRTFTARDACNNTASVSRTVRWTADNTAPSFTGSYADVILACVADAPGSLGTATATDACGAVTITSSDGSIVSNGCNRSIARTFTARDACGNTATISRTVRWISILSGPILFVGGQSITGTTTFDLGCNPLDATVNATLGEASATNECGSVSVSAFDGPVTIDGCNRARVRTFSATDGCGNIATAARIVRWIVSNIGGPQINPSSAPTVLGCNPSENDINAALGTVTATDACASITITSSDGPTQSDGCSRSRTRTFTATNGCGNTATASRTITWTADNTAPTFTGSYADVNLGCNPANPAGSLGTATATDACSTPTVTSTDGAVVSNGCNRSQIRTFTARDACGNTATISRTVRWSSSITASTLVTGGTTTTLGCNPTAGDINGALGSASATDACGNPTVTSSDGAVTSNGCARSQTRTFSATDACGNTVTASRTITWTADNTAPTFTGSYTDVNLGCNPANPAGSLGTATATDACSTPTVTSTDGAVVSNGCNRSQIRTFTVRDACGNTATISRTVRWSSSITPSTLVPTGTTTSLGCNPTPGDINGALGSASATDACGNPTVTSSDGAVTSTGCARSQTRTFRATDVCGSSVTASRTVTWTVDMTPPVFTSTPASVDINCNNNQGNGRKKPISNGNILIGTISGGIVPTVVTPTASDACGTPTVAMTGSTDNPADCATGFNRIITRTWTARDACGNTASYTQTIRYKCCETGENPNPGDIVCTLTQGAYGSPGGNICLPNGTTVNQAQIMINALTAAPGNMAVFGRQDRNRYWVVRLTDVNQGPNSNIFKMLPGGGPSAVFGLDNVSGVPEFSNSASWSVVPLDASGPQAGTIRNQLFSQTLTLYFNTTIAGSTLSNVSLNGLAVIAPRNCGSAIPAGPGTPTQLVSPVISSYLATHGYAVTVGGLLQLANDALGGVNVSPLTLTQIQEAVNNINEAFDECKILTGYVATGSSSGKVITSNSIAGQPSLIVTAFPNPYKENFSLKINSPVTGQAVISFYNMAGVKISEMKRDVVALKELWVPYAVPEGHRTRIVYTVNVGSYNARGIVLSPN